QRSDVGGRVDGFDEVDALFGEVGHPVGRHKGLAGQTLKSGPDSGLIQSHRRTYEHDVRIAVPGYVVKIVAAQGCIERNPESTPPFYDVSAGAGTVEDADSLDRETPAAKKIAIRTDRLSNRIDRLPVEPVCVRRRVLQRGSLAPVLVDDLRLP